MRKNIKAIKDIIIKLNYILDGKQKGESIIVFFSMLLVSCLELLSVSVLYPFLRMITDVNSLDNEWYMKVINRLFPSVSGSDKVLIVGISIIIVFLLKNIAALICTYLQLSFATSFRRDASTQVLRSYFDRPYEFFLNTNSSIMIRGISEDVSSVYNTLLAFFYLVGELVTSLLIGIYLVMVDWVIALFSIGVALACLSVLIFALKKKTKKAGKVFVDACAGINKSCYQAINGAKEIMVANRREVFIDEYRRAANSHAKAVKTYNFALAIPDRAIEGICMSSFVGVVCIRFVLGVDMTTFIPVLGSFAMAAFKILPLISKISTRINTVIYNQPGMQECYDNLIESRKFYRENQNPQANYDMDDYMFTDKLSLKNITWRYSNSKEKTIIDKASIDIKKGDTVALIGASGAGKTTVADIIMGLLHPQSGTVEIDGIDVFSIHDTWSKMIGYVPQTVYLTDDTIKANIAFGLEGEQTAEDKVWKALEQAQLKTFVESLPEGLNTIVGERGVKLSGGQRQRIAIARALYDDPEILVLDEATSALDNETERAVMEAIESLKGLKTLIIVAHRLSTITKCDRIYEVSYGKIVERDERSVLESK